MAILDSPDGGVVNETGEVLPPAPVAAAPAPTSATLVGRLIRSAVLRVEDLLLAGWIIAVYPLLAASQGSNSGPFDAGRPIEGLLGLAGLVGAFACIGTRNADAPADKSIVSSASIGPVVAGLMFVGASAFAGLGFDPGAGMTLGLAGGVVPALLRGALPPLPMSVRRILITPLVLVAGSIFWGFVRVFTGGHALAGDVSSVLAQAPSAAPILAVLALAAAVYYAMLIYAPRQIAEREGGPLVWLARYALFVLSVVLGLGWLSLLGG